MDENGEGIMIEREAIITSDKGVHARPAGLLVAEAKKHSCHILLVSEETEADCYSIMSILGLGLLPGTKLTIRAEGEGEKKAVDGIFSIIENEINKKQY
jgi:phosphocarrier protein HPr